MKKIYLILILIILFPLFAGAQDAYKSVEKDGVKFQWLIEGNNLRVRLSAPTDGWIAVGFNPEKFMKGADYKLAYVDEKGVTILDHFGTGFFSHNSDKDKGGTDDFTVIGGSDSNGTTVVEFTMPLNSGDPNDTVLTPGEETKVLLAYSSSDNTRRKHRWRTSLTVKL